MRLVGLTGVVAAASVLAAENGLLYGGGGDYGIVAHGLIAAGIDTAVLAK